jgi:hypothetical protein
MVKIEAHGFPTMIYFLAALLDGYVWFHDTVAGEKLEMRTKLQMDLNDS